MTHQGSYFLLRARVTHARGVRLGQQAAPRPTGPIVWHRRLRAGATRRRSLSAAPRRRVHSSGSRAAPGQRAVLRSGEGRVGCGG